MRRGAALLLAAMAALHFPASLNAQAQSCRVPADVRVPKISKTSAPRRTPITGYTLALSWSREYCNGRDNSPRDAMQCSADYGTFGFVVHGLWPEGAKTYPEYCAALPPLSAKEAKRNLCMMPSAYLQAHEWTKHGTCMAKSAAGYFKATRILWDSVNLAPIAALAGKEGITAGGVRDAFIRANPAWPRGAIGVQSGRGGWLKEIRLCYDKRFMPTPCDRKRYGLADKARLRMRS